MLGAWEALNHLVTIWPLEEVWASFSDFATLFRKQRKLPRTLQAWSPLSWVEAGSLLSCSLWLPIAGVPWLVLPLGIVKSGKTCVHVPRFLHKLLTLPHPSGPLAPILFPT